MPNRQHLYKDKSKARATHRSQNLRYYRKTQIYTGRPKWTPEEDKLVLEHSITDTELSNTIHRSVSAIQNRRSKLKKNNRE